MTTLTDRYVWAVLRAVPSRQRDELEPEIRALVADAADAHAGDAAPDAAERAALVELGDPDALAARYTDATRFLIGPRLYPEWERLLRLLLPIVAPIAGFAFGAVGWATGKPVGEAIVSGLGIAFTVVVQLAVLVHARVRDRGAGRGELHPGHGPPVDARRPARAAGAGPAEPRRGDRVGRVRGLRPRGDRLGPGREADRHRRHRLRRCSIPPCRCGCGTSWA